MSHQPYENWILEANSPSAEQELELKQHLKSCPACSQLMGAHKQVENLFSSTRIVPAPANFTRRWQANLVYRKREEEKKQARTLLISFSSVSGAILIALAALFLPKFSLISATASMVSTVVGVLNGIENFWSMMIKLAQTVPPGTLILTSLFVSAWILLICALWGVSIWKLAIKRGLVK